MHVISHRVFIDSHVNLHQVIFNRRPSPLSQRAFPVWQTIEIGQSVSHSILIAATKTHERETNNFSINEVLQK